MTPPKYNLEGGGVRLEGFTLDKSLPLLGAGGAKGWVFRLKILPLPHLCTSFFPFLPCLHILSREKPPRFFHLLGAKAGWFISRLQSQILKAGAGPFWYASLLLTSASPSSLEQLF